jgi:hypothetical protein
MGRRFGWSLYWPSRSSSPMVVPAPPPEAPAPNLQAYFIIVPSGATRYQTLPTPWPVMSPGALSFSHR